MQKRDRRVEGNIEEQLQHERDAMMDICEEEDFSRKMAKSTCSARKSSGSTKINRSTTTGLILAALLSSTPVAMAKCIKLTGSTSCPAFSAGSVSTDLAPQYPFLQFVSNTQDFDKQFSQYVSSGYVQLKYQQLLGCDNVDLTNTTSLYARYTTSVICNAMVQNSKTPCSLSNENSRPLCADTCAQMATNEEAITTDSTLCGNPGPKFIDQIRADFTVCALPADSLSGDCISGEENEPDNCGFSSNLSGLCGYCGMSSPNATDSCCINSKVTTRCKGVTLPTFATSMPPLFPSSTSSTTPTATNSTTGSKSGGGGLSGGQIAGIVVGAVLGGLLLLALLILCCIFMRRRRRTTQRGSVFNQPSPQRQGAQMTYAPPPRNGQPQGYEVLPGGRVARMSALQGPGAGGSPPTNAPIVGARGYHESSDTDPYGDSPESQGKLGPPVTGKRTASLSSNSVLQGEHDTSPNSGSGGQFSSPEGVASGQSEQLPFFKDYYSQDEIHPNDKVSVLWAYQPRAGDEFELERGDMLKVVGIWDDGWATGVRISDRAEDYDGKNRPQRDSGVSNGSGRRGSSPQPSGEIKAFPLVCVCLPEHWNKTIEGDGSTESGSGGPPPGL